MRLLNSFFRNFSANRQLYLVNLLGLIPGFICCLLIFMWMMGEIGTHRGYSTADRLVFVHGYYGNDGNKNMLGGCPPAVAPVLEAEFPEVVCAARYVPLMLKAVTVNQKKYEVSSVYADPELFTVLGMEFIEGESFMRGEIGRCVISQRTAKQLFPDVSALGQFVEIDGQKLAVCGVTRELPRNSLSLPIIVPINLMKQKFGDDVLDSWYNSGFPTLVLLQDETGLGVFKEKIKERVIREHAQYNIYLDAYKLKDLYLYKQGNIKNVGLVGMIALFILVIACINFINLSTAGFIKSSFRTGICKMIGATRWELLLRDYVNTLFLVFLGFLVSLGVGVLLLPFFNALVGGNFTEKDFFHPLILGGGCVAVILVTLLAGTYPAFYLSSFKPARVLKGHCGIEGKSGPLRGMLVTLQFTVSVVLIISTIVILKQVRMYRQMDLGYERMLVAWVPLDGDLKGKAEVLKAELQKESAIDAVSIAPHLPTGIYWSTTGLEWEGKEAGTSPLVMVTQVDNDWAKVMGVKFREGGFPEEGNHGVVINAKLAELIGWDSFTGKFLGGEKITGVLDNFKFNDFKTDDAALMLMPLVKEAMGNYNYLLVRMDGRYTREAYDAVKNQVAEMNGGIPVTIHFLDDDVEYTLRSEKKMIKMVSSFSLMAIAISCLGLFGMAMFMVEQKRKEIGIRRVSGARIGEIIWLLNVNLVRPVLWGYLLACPLAYYWMSCWLEGYLQRTELSWWIFAGVGFVACAIALLTIGWQSWRAAAANPVNSLKSE